MEEIQENTIRELRARHHRKYISGSIPAMKETLRTEYRQKKGLL
jgi:hypothetical protein